MDTLDTSLAQAISCESLEISKTIGQGKLPVFLAYCPVQKKNYALKVFPKNLIGTIQYKKHRRLSILSHSNIIKNVDVVSDSDGYHPTLMEFAKYGNFLDLVLGSVLSVEILIRTYFHQLIAGVEYLHAQRIAHLDLKLENLVMASDFVLKIIDFDQAQSIKEKKIELSDTVEFRAPEIIDGTCTNLEAADIYSLGMILYALKTQKYPPVEHISQDIKGREHSMIDDSKFENNNCNFWKIQTSDKNNETVFSSSFKELVNGLLEPEVDRRFTMKDIKKSKWFNGPTLDRINLAIVMKARCAEFINKREKRINEA